MTSIGEDAFSWNYQLTNVEIPNSVESVQKWAFAKDTQLAELVLPSSVSNIGDLVLSGAKSDMRVVIENPNVVLSNIFGYSMQVYCQSLEQCSGKGVSDDRITVFSKTSDGIYQIDLGDDAVYYATAGLMTQGEEKACRSLMHCQKILGAKQKDNMYILDGRSYASMNDLLNGNYVKKRIYTIKEANEVAGKKNSVMIRYK